MRWRKFTLAFLCCMLPTQVHGQVCALNRPQSLLDRFQDVEILVVAQPRNAVAPDNSLPNGQTELAIDEVVKPHKILKDCKSIITPRCIESKEKFLVALEVNKGEIDAYMATPLDANGAILKYVRGGLQLKDKSALARLRYNVDFLHDPCREVADSAHIEIGRASYGNLRKIAEAMKPAPLAKALADGKKPISQRGTFALLLGHCGKREDAVALRKLIDADETASSALAQMLFAYVLLDREAGWAYVTQASVKEAQTQSFPRRYAALLAIRRLGAERKDLVSEKQRDAALLGIVKIADMADFAIEDLRKLNRWEHCDAILELDAKEGYQTGIMRKALLRFALQCPAPRAVVYVNEARARDPEWVSETSELLDLEKEDAKPPTK